MPRLTIRDVAKESSVSPGAVSQILRGGGRFSKSTRDRVIETAKRLGYHPDPLVASRKTDKFKAGTPADAYPIALLGNADKRLRNMTPGLVDYAARIGYSLEVFPMNGELSDERLSGILFARGVVGVIMEPIYGMKEPPKIEWDRFSCVASRKPYFNFPLDCVNSKNFEKILQLAQKLRDTGYKRIGFDLVRHISWGNPHPDDIRRHAAALHFQSNLPPEERVPIHYAPIANTFAFHNWFEKHKPDALVSMIPRDSMFPSGKCPVPYVANTVGDENDAHVTGFRRDQETILKYSVEMLDMLVRRNQTGLREFPFEHLIAPEWNEATSHLR